MLFFHRIDRETAGETGKFVLIDIRPDRVQTAVELFMDGHTVGVAGEIPLSFFVTLLARSGTAYVAVNEFGTLVMRVATTSSGQFEDETGGASLDMGLFIDNLFGSGDPNPDGFGFSCDYEDGGGLGEDGEP